MLRLLLATLVLMSIAPANAVTRYESSRLECARIQAIIESDLVVILRYPSPRNSQLTLYDMYAAHTRHCPSGEIARPSTVPARDMDNCRVRRCQPKSTTSDR